MLTQRSCSATVWGYSSQSMAFLLAVSTMRRSASSSMYVVTNVARLSAGFASRASSSWMNWYASRGSIDSSGSTKRGMEWVMPREA